MPSSPRTYPRSTHITRRRRVVAIAAAALMIAVGTAITVQLTSPSDDALGAPVTLDMLGDDDGFLDTGDAISAFANELPAIADLDPALRDAMQAAARAASDDDVVFVVTSGWRSERYQQALFDDAVREYGSAAEAAKWVATPQVSKHVTGEAVDIGYTDANSWLSQHGADFGLCQTYANEMWHFELATEPGGECPPQLSDASEVSG